MNSNTDVNTEIHAITTDKTTIATAVTNTISSTKMSINSLKAASTPEPVTTGIEAVRLTETPTPICLFSDQVEKATLHYLETPEKRGYFRCNGAGCALCSAGNKPFTRILVPVYNLINREVEVLPMSEANNPHALLPQVLPVFDATEPTILMVSRQYSKYTVTLRPVLPNIDMGQSKIEAFNTAFDNGEIQLSSIYPTSTNQELAAIPSIQTMLLLNGHTETA